MQILSETAKTKHIHASSKLKLQIFSETKSTMMILNQKQSWFKTTETEPNFKQEAQLLLG